MLNQEKNFMLNIRVIASQKTVWDDNAEEVVLPSGESQLENLKVHKHYRQQQKNVPRC